MAKLDVGEVALVTGGGSGIGRSCAQVLAREGARVLVWDVDLDGAAETAELIRKDGGEAHPELCDVSDFSAVEAALARGLETYGRLDCAVNNAGIQGALALTGACTKENWDRIIGTNLSGVWHCMRCEIPAMLETGGGSIVNIASNFGLVGSVGMPAYSASKHGLIGLTKTAALEYATEGVRVNVVCPGPVDTPLIGKVIRAQPELGDDIVDAIVAREPIGRLGQPEEIGEAAAWLCSRAASFVTGSVLSVDGGFVAQ